MNTITVTNRQSIFDIAILYCGTMQAAFRIAQLNNRSLTDNITAGEQLIVPAVDDEKVVQHYQVNHILPATAITPDEVNNILLTGDGIEFQAIEIDFIVS